MVQWYHLGYGSMESSDKDNNWIMRANEKAVEFLDCMLSRLDSIQSFEQLMRQWIEDDSKNGKQVVEEIFETEQCYE